MHVSEFYERVHMKRFHLHLKSAAGIILRQIGGGFYLDSLISFQLIKEEKKSLN